VEDLRGPSETLEEALKKDLSALKAQLRAIRREERQCRAMEPKRIPVPTPQRVPVVAPQRVHTFPLPRMPKPTPQRAPVAASQPAYGTREEYHGHLESTLREAERRGELSPAEIEDLAAGAQGVLNRSVAALNANATPENMDKVLKDWSTTQMLGGGDGDERALQSLAMASAKLEDRADEEFRKNPDMDNFSKLVSAMTVRQSVGGPERKPPAGFHGAKPGTFYVVRPGDTLLIISVKQYGHAKYWDQIYWANLEVIGPDAAQVPIGAKLMIP